MPPAGSGSAIPPRISVLMTGRNCEPWIAQAIRSVLGQDYPDFELLVGLDAPQDGSEAAALACSGFDELVVHRQKTTTLLNHMDLVRKAAGEIVAIVDADDYLLHQDVLSRVAKEYEDPEVDMTHGSFITPSPEGMLLAVAADWQRGASAFGKWPFCHLKTWRRALSLRAFEENPEAFAYEDGSPILYGPDVAFTYPVAARARKVVAIKEPLYFYRLHADNEHVAHRAEQLRTEQWCGQYWQNVIDRETVAA